MKLKYQRIRRNKVVIKFPGRKVVVKEEGCPFFLKSIHKVCENECHFGESAVAVPRNCPLRWGKITIEVV